MVKFSWQHVIALIDQHRPLHVQCPVCCAPRGISCEAPSVTSHDQLCGVGRLGAPHVKRCERAFTVNEIDELKIEAARVSELPLDDFKDDKILNSLPASSWGEIVRKFGDERLSFIESWESSKLPFAQEVASRTS